MGFLTLPIGLNHKKAGGGGGGGGTTLTYVSDGDTNGAMYYLGTDGYSVSFTNPYGVDYTFTVIGSLGVSGTGTSGYELITDRGAESSRTISFFSSTSATNGFRIDFLVPSFIKYNRVSILARTNGGSSSTFNIFASTDGTNWVSIGTIPVNDNGGIFAWRHAIITNTNFYQYFKIEMPVNSAFTSLGEIEFYGEIAI